MSIVLFDNAYRQKLYPLVAVRAVADLRFGIVTIKERWELITQQQVFVQTEKYLGALYEAIPDEEHVWIDASIIADEDLLQRILSLQPGEALQDIHGVVAVKSSGLNQFGKIIPVNEAKRIVYPWNLFQINDYMLRKDFELITKGRTSQPISSSNNICSPENIFIEEGANVEFATLNASAGPIYIGKNAEVWEGSVIRGTFAIKENAVIKAGAKIYGATTIGPWCAAGGEIKNAILMGYSNKAHDGYLGDSVIAYWCNFGAGSSNSNVKNTAGDIMMPDDMTNEKINVGQKCGVMMGDYSRVAINSSINTGSVIGVCANVFGAGLLPKKINDFTWGINNEYEFEKAVRDIDNWKRMKHQNISAKEIEVLKRIFAAKN